MHPMKPVVVSRAMTSDVSTPSEDLLTEPDDGFGLVGHGPYASRRAVEIAIEDSEAAALVYLMAPSPKE